MNKYGVILSVVEGINDEKTLRKITSPSVSDYRKVKLLESSIEDKELRLKFKSLDYNSKLIAIILLRKKLIEKKFTA